MRRISRFSNLRQDLEVKMLKVIVEEVQKCVCVCKSQEKSDCRLPEVRSKEQGARFVGVKGGGYKLW